MGISKAMMEKLITSKTKIAEDNKTILCATRYGNVMGSRGSVIPHFMNLIKNRKPLTVTDPAMSRFMMSLEDSVNLVLYAFQHANQGDIFIQKAPAATVGEIAKVMNKIFSKSSKIKIIGTRHGEKLFETLISREEMIRAKDLKSFYRIPSDNRDLNYDKYFTKGKSFSSRNIDYTSHNTKLLNTNELEKLLMSLDFIKEELNA
jgi:UDP-glucose 4-epimerase